MDSDTLTVVGQWFTLACTVALLVAGFISEVKDSYESWKRRKKVR